MISYNICNELVIVDDKKNYFIKKENYYYKELSKVINKKNLNKKKKIVTKINNDDQKINIVDHDPLIDDLNKITNNNLILNKKIKGKYKYIENKSLLKKVNMMHKLI